MSQDPTVCQGPALLSAVHRFHASKKLTVLSDRSIGAGSFIDDSTSE